MNFKTLLIILVLIVTFQCVFGQSIAELDKRQILRLVTPEGGLGTGFYIIDPELHGLIVTSKHLLRSTKSGKYFDSILVLENEVLANGKVRTSDEMGVLHLRHKGVPLFKTHPDSNIDLAVIYVGMIRLHTGDFVLNPSNHPEWIFGFKSSLIASRDDFKTLNIRDGTRVQIVGFSYQVPQQQQFHISRFGSVALLPGEKVNLLFTDSFGGRIDSTFVSSEWLILDVSSRGGDSGGPVFAFAPGTGDVWLIGLVKGNSSMELCIAQPSYYLVELLDTLRNNFKK